MAKVRRKLVEVRWIDSTFHTGWRKADRPLPELTICRTVGYMVSDGKKTVVVSMNSEKDGDYSETMVIPRSCVRSVRRVKR